MKKLILGILFAIAFVGCGKNEIDLYTSYEYKEDFIDRMSADNILDKKLHRQLGDVIKRLSKIQDPKAQEEIELWGKAIVERSEREAKRRRKQKSEWEEIQEYKNSLAVPLNPDL